MDSRQIIELTQRFSAHNYGPLDVVLRGGEGSWVEDVEGKRYLDLLSAYGANNFGHKNPRIIKAAHEQLEKLTLVS
jgi:ornithine--oxo-acid transaminase